MQVAPGCRVKTGSGFIQHEYFRLQCQRGCQGYLAFFAAAQVVGEPVFEGFKINPTSSIAF